MWRILIFLLVIPLFSLAQSPSRNSVEDPEIPQSEYLIAQKKYAEASALLTKYIKKKPDSFFAYVLRSKVKYILKDYNGSIEDSKVVLSNKTKTDPTSLLLANFNTGVCYNSLNDNKKAIYFLKKAKQIDSTYVETYYSLSYSYLALSEIDSANLEIDNWIKIKPLDERAHYGKGKIHYMKEEYRQAISAYNKAINLNKNYILAYQNRGSAKHMLGDKEGGCQDWKKCLELGYTPVESLIKQLCK